MYFLKFRLSPQPHYFAVAEIGYINKYPERKKQDYYAELVKFRRFEKHVYFKQNNETIEIIPHSRKKIIIVMVLGQLIMQLMKEYYKLQA